jgi:uncharacterized protein with HEPN domain
MEKQVYSFEVLCLEPQDSDIQNTHSFLKALAYSSKLWGGRECQELSSSQLKGLSESELKISLYIKQLDTSRMLTDYSESGFILLVHGKDFDSLEMFRLRLLRHLKTTLRFSHIRILTDDVSTSIANQLYPQINMVESLLRRYLVKFFIQRVGINWWETTATRLMIEKVKSRLEKKDEFSNLIDQDVSQLDFDDLGELIYKQTSGFNQTEKIVNKLLSLDTIEDLRHLQKELQGNYTKYFKEFFQDKHFEQLWKELLRIRNKVAHQGTFYGYDLERGLHITDALAEIIGEAEVRIDEVVFSTEEKDALRKATIHASMVQHEGAEDQTEPTEDDSDYFRGGLRGLKVVGKILLPTKEKYITEEETLHELENALSQKYNYYVGLKWFVTVFLKNKGYVVSTSYSVINIMIDKDLIDIYEVATRDGYLIKALRLPD